MAVNSDTQPPVQSNTTSSAPPVPSLSVEEQTRRTQRTQTTGLVSGHRVSAREAASQGFTKIVSDVAGAILSEAADKYTTALTHIKQLSNDEQLKVFSYYPTSVLAKLKECSLQTTNFAALTENIELAIKLENISGAILKTTAALDLTGLKNFVKTARVPTVFQAVTELIHASTNKAMQELRGFLGQSFVLSNDTIDFFDAVISNLSFLKQLKNNESITNGDLWPCFRSTRNEAFWNLVRTKLSESTMPQVQTLVRCCKASVEQGLPSREVIENAVPIRTFLEKITDINTQRQPLAFFRYERLNLAVEPRYVTKGEFEQLLAYNLTGGDLQQVKTYIAKFAGINLTNSLITASTDAVKFKTICEYLVKVGVGNERISMEVVRNAYMKAQEMVSSDTMDVFRRTTSEDLSEDRLLRNLQRIAPYADFVLYIINENEINGFLSKLKSVRTNNQELTRLIASLQAKAEEVKKKRFPSRPASSGAQTTSTQEPARTRSSAPLTQEELREIESFESERTSNSERDGATNPIGKLLDLHLERLRSKKKGEFSSEEVMPAIRALFGSVSAPKAIKTAFKKEYLVPLHPDRTGRDPKRTELYAVAKNLYDEYCKLNPSQTRSEQDGS